MHEGVIDTRQRGAVPVEQEMLPWLLQRGAVPVEQEMLQMLPWLRQKLAAE